MTCILASAGMSFPIHASSDPLQVRPLLSLLRSDHFITLIDQIKGEVQSVLIPDVNGHPAIPADVGGDLDVGMLNQGSLLIQRGFDRYHWAFRSAETEYLAPRTDLEDRLAPRMIFERLGLGEAVRRNLGNRV